MRAMDSVWRYSPPWWLRGAHAQTIWSARLARHWQDQPAPLRTYLGRASASTEGGVIAGWRVPPVPADLMDTIPHWERERWQTPDSDFIDVDHLVMPPLPKDMGKKAPLVVLFHGLEGSRHSHYVHAMAHACQTRGWQLMLPHFRGCSGEINLAPRAYHSGDFEEIDWILRRAANLHPGVPVVAVGVSLGGNALLRWAGELGEAAGRVVRSVAAICPPLDLVASGQAIGRGINRVLYTRMFLASMKPKARAKWVQYPELFNLDAAMDAKTILEFDNAFTAPVHGFKHVLDYWSRASAKPHLKNVAIPALVINSKNDPFIPFESIPIQAEVADAITLWQPAGGGHVGFTQAGITSRPPGHISGLPRAVLDWLAANMSLSVAPTQPLLTTPTQQASVVNG